MKNIILFSLGLSMISFTGCATKNINKKVEVKKMVKKNSPQTEKKRVVDDYKTVVNENIKRSKNQEKARAKYIKDKDKILEKMEVARKNFAKTNDRKKYIKIKNKTTKELHTAQEKLDKTIKMNKIINYTEDKNINNSH